MRENNFKFIKNAIVIVFLLLLLTIGAFVVVPSVIKDLNSKEILSNQEGAVEQAAERYFDDNKEKLPTNIGDTVEISLAELVDNAYLDDIYDSDGNLCFPNTSTVTIKKIDDIKYQYYVDLFCNDYASLETWTNWSGWNTDEPPTGENIQSENLLFYKLREGDVKYDGWSSWKDYDSDTPEEKDGYELETRTVYRSRDQQWKWYYEGSSGSTTTSKEYADSYYLTAPSGYTNKDSSDYIVETKYTKTGAVKEYTSSYYGSAPSGYPSKSTSYKTQYQYLKTTISAFTKHYATSGGISYGGKRYYGTIYYTKGTNRLETNKTYAAPGAYTGSLPTDDTIYKKDNNSYVTFKMCQPVSWIYNYTRTQIVTYTTTISITTSTYPTTTNKVAECAALAKTKGYPGYQVLTYQYSKYNSNGTVTGYLTCKLKKYVITTGTLQTADGNLPAVHKEGNVSTAYKRTTMLTDSTRYYAKSCPLLNKEWDTVEIGSGTLYRYYVNVAPDDAIIATCVPSDCKSWLNSPRTDLSSSNWLLKTRRLYKYYKTVPDGTQEKWSEVALDSSWTKTSTTRKLYKYYKENTTTVGEDGKLYTTKYSSLAQKGYPKKDISLTRFTDFSSWSITAPSVASYRTIEDKTQVKYRKVTVNMDDDFGEIYYTQTELEKKTGLSLAQIEKKPTLEYQKIYLNRYRTRRTEGIYVEPGNEGLKSWLDTLIRCFITVILVLYLIIGPHYGEKWLLAIFNLITSVLAISEYQLYIWGIAQTLEILVIIFNIVILVLMIYGNSQYVDESVDEY